MKKIRNYLSVLLALSLGFSNIIPAFASGEDLTQNGEKSQSDYSDVKENLENKSDKTGNKETKGDYNKNQEKNNIDKKVLESLITLDSDKDTNEESSSEINNENKGKAKSTTDETYEHKVGKIGDADWEINEDGTATIKNGKMAEREYNSWGQATEPEAYEALIYFTGELTIENTVIFPEDSKDLFNYYQANKININSNVNTSSVKNMSNMFSNCKKLTEINGLDNLDTSSVTDMNSMFYGCWNLTEINGLDKFDTSNVTDMSWMFHYCWNLTKINGLEKFDTSNVTDMSWMFDYCPNLTEINGLDKFDTSKVTDMSGMFNFCQSLIEITGLNKFDTSNVENMSNMFSVCNDITSLNLSDFNTSKVTDMSNMFNFSQSLIEINGLEKFDTSRVTDMSQMFADCENIISLNLSNFDKSNVQYLDDMFYGCSSIRALALGENIKDLSSSSLPDITDDFETYTGKWVYLDNPNVIFDSSSDLIGQYDGTNQGTYIWQKRGLNIMFYANGGEGSMDEQVINTETETPLKENEFTRDGYHFDHWNTEADDSGDSYAIDTIFTKKAEGILKLYAQWKENDYNILFESNGGKGTMENQIIKYDSLNILNKNEFTKEGYHFDHWNTKADDTGNSYTDMAVLPKTDKEDVTLYAQWEKDKVKDPDVKPNLDSKPDKEKPSDEKKDKKNKSGNKNASKNPKTGILASSGLVLLLAASGAYVSSKRKD